MYSRWKHSKIGKPESLRALPFQFSFCHSPPPTLSLNCATRQFLQFSRISNAFPAILQNSQVKKYPTVPHQDCRYTSFEQPSFKIYLPNHWVYILCLTLLFLFLLVNLFFWLFVFWPISLSLPNFGRLLCIIRWGPRTKSFMGKIFKGNWETSLKR